MKVLPLLLAVALASCCNSQPPAVREIRGDGLSRSAIDKIIAGQEQDPSPNAAARSDSRLLIQSGPDTPPAPEKAAGATKNLTKRPAELDLR